MQKVICWWLFNRESVLLMGAVCISLLILVWFSGVQAEIKTYTDENGVIHFETTEDTETQTSALEQENIPPRKSVSLEEKRAFVEYIKKQSPKYGLDSALVRAIVKVESNFNPYCVSAAGAEGIMQLMPQTARRFSVSNSFDAYQNIDGGLRYLRFLMKLFNEDVRLVVAAYNAGENAVSKYNGIPPFPETRKFVQNVLSLYKSGFYQISWQPKPAKKLYTYKDENGTFVITTKKPGKKSSK